MGLFCGAVGDIVQFVIKPTGPYFPGWTLSAALACFIYGMFFYKHFPAKKSYNKGQAIRSFLHIDIAFLVRTILAVALDIVLVNILLGTYWVNLMYGKGFWFYFSTRFVKNMIQLPINVILSYYVLAFLRDIRAKIHI
jgi:ECF transporter S component (folate family)